MSWGSAIGAGLGLGAGALAKKKENDAAEQAQGILAQNAQVLGMMSAWQQADVQQQKAKTAHNVAQIGASAFNAQKQVLKKLGPAMNPNVLPGLGTTKAGNLAPFTGGKSMMLGGGY